MPSLLTLPIDAANLEGVLEALIRPSFGHIDYADKTVVVFEELIAAMKSTVHSDDFHHHGESIFEHVQEVVAAAADFHKDLPPFDRQAMMLTAVLHDITKPASHTLHPTKPNKHQFPNHWNNGAPIARIIMARFLGTWADFPEMDLMERVTYLVEHHHDFFIMVDARENVINATNPYRRYGYVRKFLQDGKHENGRMEEMLRFMRCDVISSKDHAKRCRDVEPVLEDIQRLLELPDNTDKTEANRPYYEGLEAGRSGVETANPYTDPLPKQRWSVGYDQGRKGR